MTGDKKNKGAAEDTTEKEREQREVDFLKQLLENAQKGIAMWQEEQRRLEAGEEGLVDLEKVRLNSAKRLERLKKIMAEDESGKDISQYDYEYLHGDDLPEIKTQPAAAGPSNPEVVVSGSEVQTISIVAADSSDNKTSMGTSNLSKSRVDEAGRTGFITTVDSSDSEGTDDSDNEGEEAQPLGASPQLTFPTTLAPSSPQPATSSVPKPSPAAKSKDMRFILKSAPYFFTASKKSQTELPLTTKTPYSYVANTAKNNAQQLDEYLSTNDQGNVLTNSLDDKHIYIKNLMAYFLNPDANSTSLEKDAEQLMEYVLNRTNGGLFDNTTRNVTSHLLTRPRHTRFFNKKIGDVTTENFIKFIQFMETHFPNVRPHTAKFWEMHKKECGHLNKSGNEFVSRDERTDGAVIIRAIEYSGQMVNVAPGLSYYVPFFTPEKSRYVSTPSIIGIRGFATSFIMRSYDELEKAFSHDLYRFDKGTYLKRFKHYFNPDNHESSYHPTLKNEMISFIQALVRNDSTTTINDTINFGRMIIHTPLYAAVDGLTASYEAMLTYAATHPFFASETVQYAVKDLGAPYKLNSRLTSNNGPSTSLYSTLSASQFDPDAEEISGTIRESMLSKPLTADPKNSRNKPFGSSYQPTVANTCTLQQYITHVVNNTKRTTKKETGFFNNKRFLANRHVPKEEASCVSYAINGEVSFNNITPKKKN